MTVREVITELKAECKPYALLKMDRRYYSKMLRQIWNGKAKPQTMRDFFAKFGYIPATQELYDCSYWLKLPKDEKIIKQL